MKQYEHTQIGYLIIVPMAIAVVVVAYSIATKGANAIGVAVDVLVLVFMVLFATLTVTIRDGMLEARFGPGLIRKRVRLTDIESYEAVRNPLYYGWGIRMTPHGWLYSVSGLSAIEIKLKSGQTLRIGTDVPTELNAALDVAIGPRRRHT